MLPKNIVSTIFGIMEVYTSVLLRHQTVNILFMDSGKLVNINVTTMQALERLII